MAAFALTAPAAPPAAAPTVAAAARHLRSSAAAARPQPEAASLSAACAVGVSAAFALAGAARRRGAAARKAAAASTARAARVWSPSMAENPEIDPRPREAPSSVPPVQMPMIDTGEGGKIDVMSKLLQDRIIICSGQVADDMAQVIISQMLYLAGENPEADITMYINSPGGSVSAGLAIYDTMQFIPCNVSTVCFGLAASMGSFLLAAGTKGQRKSLPNSRVMIHQPLGGAQGPAADVELQAKEILFLREILNMHLADMTGQPQDKIKADCDRDNFMTPEEAKEYGLIDEIVQTKSWPRLQKPPRPELNLVSAPMAS